MLRPPLAIESRLECFSPYPSSFIVASLQLNPTKEELDVAKTIVSVFANSGKGKVLLNTGNAM